jgi:hypothetical protein
MSETEEIEKLLKKMGWEHHQGQPMPGTPCTEVHFFINGNDLIEVTLEEDVDQETLEAIRGD